MRAWMTRSCEPSFFARYLSSTPLRQAMIDEFDLDQDGEISEAEFVRLSSASQTLQLTSTQIAIMTDDL